MSEPIDTVPIKKNWSFKRKLIVGFLLVIILVLISNFLTNPYRLGIQALERGNYESAIKFLGNVSGDNKKDADEKLAIARDKYYNEFDAFYNDCRSKAFGSREIMLKAILPAYDRILIVEKILPDDNRVKADKAQLENQIRLLKMKTTR